MPQAYLYKEWVGTAEMWLGPNFTTWIWNADLWLNSKNNKAVSKQQKQQSSEYQPTMQGKTEDLIWMIKFWIISFG